MTSLMDTPPEAPTDRLEPLAADASLKAVRFAEETPMDFTKVPSSDQMLSSADEPSCAEFTTASLDEGQSSKVVRFAEEPEGWRAAGDEPCLAESRPRGDDPGLVRFLASETGACVDAPSGSTHNELARDPCAPRSVYAMEPADNGQLAPSDGTCGSRNSATIKHQVELFEGRSPKGVRFADTLHGASLSFDDSRWPDEGFDANQLQGAGFDASQLPDAGFAASQRPGAGFDASGSCFQAIAPPRDTKVSAPDSEEEIAKPGSSSGAVEAQPVMDIWAMAAQRASQRHAQLASDVQRVAANDGAMDVWTRAAQRRWAHGDLDEAVKKWRCTCRGQFAARQPIAPMNRRLNAVKNRSA